MEVISKIKSQYDSDLISLSDSKAKQLSAGDSIVFFDKTISVFRSWDSFLRLVNKFSLNDNIEINTEDLSSSKVNYKIQIKNSEIVGIRVIGTHAILGLAGSHNGFISDGSTSDEILEITYNKSDQLERLFLEIKYLRTFQSIFKDRIILEPSNQYGDGLSVPIGENEINQLKKIIVNEQQSNDVVLQNTQTYESYLHIVFLAVAILFPFDVLRLLASFAGVVLSLVIIADEKKKSTEKIVSSILIVGYILYALVVINYYF